MAAPAVFAVIEPDGVCTYADYQCLYGGDSVPLSDCMVYGTTFNAGDRANVHAFADPSTGALTDGQTSLSDVDLIKANLASRTTAISANFSPLTEENYNAALTEIAEECYDEVGIPSTGTQQYEDLPIVAITLQDCENDAIYSTAEGSPGADLKQINADDNGKQGRQLSTFYSQCSLDGTGTTNEYLVVADPFYDSVAFCTQ